MPRIVPCWLLVGFLALLAGGCSDTGPSHRQGAKKENPPAKGTSAQQAQSPRGDSGPDRNSAARQKPPVVLETPPKKLPGGGSRVAVRSAGDEHKSPGHSNSELMAQRDPLKLRDDDASRALSRIADEMAESLRLKKTLVVWLVDQSARSIADSRRLFATSPISHVAETAIARAKSHDTADAAGHQLSQALVAYGRKVEILTPEPLDDARKIDDAVGRISPGLDDVPLTFTAVNQAADHFLPYRQQGYELLLVVVANNAGDDWDQYDAVLPKLHRAAVPVFGIGDAVPFARQVHFPEEQKEAQRPLNIPCESCDLEQIDLGLPGMYGDMDLSDSGFGPFGLERLCRATEGEFLRLRSSRLSIGWRLAESGQVDPELLRRYAPDYISPTQYQQLLAANKARMALHNAAQLPYAAALGGGRGGLQMNFPRGRDEADLARRVGMAQRAAAERSPDVDRIYDALAPGDADRSKLTSPRWQANFDLAMGRILAAKARIDGYNAQLAIVKQGKPFAKKESDMWVLHPAETISAGSAMDSMAKKARTYLNRVIVEHPGTPWAAMATRELGENIGWEWTELSTGGRR